MIIAIICNNFPPIVDGVGDYTYRLASEFAIKGHEVSVFCSAKQEIEKFIDQKSLPFKVFPIVQGWNVKGVNVCVKQIKQANPDWILLQYVPYSYDYYGIPFVICYLCSLLKIGGFKLFVFFHEVRIKLHFHQKNFVVGLGQALIAKFIYRISTKASTSNKLYRNLLDRDPSKISIIPVGSNIPLKEVDVYQLKQYKGYQNEDILLATFGRTVRSYKNLLLALKNLVDRDNNLRLIMMGKIAQMELEMIKKMIYDLDVMDNVVITGYLKDYQVYQYLLISDIYIMLDPTNTLNWSGTSTRSGTLAAAFSASLPVIGTKGELTDSFFSNKNNFLFTDPNDHNKIAEDIQLLINDETLKNKIGLNGKYCYDQYLSWDQIAKQYLKLIKNHE